MSALVLITGASRGIGRALADTVPFEGARVVDVSRSGAEGLAHVPADLSDPASWPEVAAALRREVDGFDGGAVVLWHCAGTLDPIGFAGEVDDAAYARNAVLNSAAGQALGHAFLAATRGLAARRDLVMISSGAATSAYEGWSGYCAGKAALEQWVRTVGLEQRRRGGARVLAIAPGVVATAMQEQIRATPERDFPRRDKFVALHEEGRLRDPQAVARDLWAALDLDLDSGDVVDLRDLESIRPGG